MKCIRKIWNYFKGSWEGSDGKASSKKLTLLAFTIQMLVYAWFVQTEVHFKVFITFAVLVAILLGIATWANIATLTKFLLPKLRLEKDDKCKDDDTGASEHLSE